MPAKNPYPQGKVIDITDRRNTIYYYELHFYDKDRSINRVCHWLDDLQKNPQKVAFEKERLAEKYSDYELTFELTVVPLPRRKLKSVVRHAIRKRREQSEDA